MGGINIGVFMQLLLAFIAMFSVAGVCIYLARRLFGISRGSVADDFERQLQAAKEMEQEILKLKKESVRGTADFEEAKRKYYAKYGRPDGDGGPKL